ncbi:MAG TPA: AAA family ATPase [Rectinema sp.]|nr:AAA family ATPase [Rectinema sp.]
MDNEELKNSARALQETAFELDNPAKSLNSADIHPAQPFDDIPDDLPSSDSKEAIDPISAITKEVEEVKRSADRCGLLSVRPANTWVEEAMTRPNPESYYHGLFFEEENTVLFAASNVGKSIFAVQVAESIARNHKVMIIDCELSDKQFQLRYTDDSGRAVHVFPVNLLRAEINPEYITESDLEKAILDSIEEAAQKGIKHIVVDNITFLCNDSEKGVTAGEFMIKLIRLKRQYHLTTIIIAHTPKRDGSQPLGNNDLAGSAKLMNFFDAAIALGKSAKDENLRYLKQVKVRSSEFKYTSENVAVYEIKKDNGYLHYAYLGTSDEMEHLKRNTKESVMEEMQQILQLVEKKVSLRDIADQLQMSLGKVQRRLAKAKKLGITIEKKDDDDVSAVSPVSDSEKPIQPIQSDTPRLPFKDNED